MNFLLLKPLKHAWWAAAAALVLALAGCGGGGGASGTSTFGTGSGGGGTGGGTPTTPTASDISLTLSSASVLNSGSGTVTATVTAVDANRNTVAGIPVTIQVDSDATVSVSGTATGASGVVTGVINVGANRSNRVVTVTATSGSISKQTAIQVTGAKVLATALPSVVAPSGTGKIQYTVSDSTSNPIGNTDVVVSGVGGVQVTGKTNASGQYEYSYTAPATAGNIDIRATSAGVDAVTTVVVQAGPGAVPAVTPGSVRSRSVSANPSVVTVNTTGEANRIEVRALFVGDNNKPIKNIRVRFNLAGDANSIGGTFSSGNLPVLSNDNGIAQTSYIAGSRFSPTDGLTIRACWDYNDFDAGVCPRESESPTTKVTVISDALSVTLGTDNLIVIGDLVYTQRFIVQVNDSSGLAKADALVSPLLDLPSYVKGFWTRPPAAEEWTKVVSQASCENEDLNRNGVVEVYSNGGVEDANSSGQLDPRKADAVVAVEGSNRTNAAGQIILRVTYPQNVGSWVNFRLTVAATGVSGTEGRANFSGQLAVPISVVKNEATPPFVVSPYGTGPGTPLIVLTSPSIPASTASLCGS